MSLVVIAGCSTYTSSYEVTTGGSTKCVVSVGNTPLSKVLEIIDEHLTQSIEVGPEVSTSETVTLKIESPTWEDALQRLAARQGWQVDLDDSRETFHISLPATPAK
jgi:type II secretory pathway component GspD/PulD (secretin)